MADPLAPPLTVLVKLGSIALHPDELISPSGHDFDQTVIQALLKDAEVAAWLNEMDKMALLPKKRT